MHEMAIAVALLDQVLEAAATHRASQVMSLELSVGSLQAVVPEALAAAWEAVSDGTLAAGSKLVCVEVPAQARCRECACEFRPGVAYYVCPRCGQADAEIIAGKDVFLTAMECETPEEESRGQD